MLAGKCQREYLFMNRFQLNQTLAVVRALDIAHNGAPEAIFDPLLQGFNGWGTVEKEFNNEE